MAGFRLIYGADILDPSNVLIPDQAINPFFQRMFMANPVGCDASVAKSIAAPLGRVYFSGSATNADFLTPVNPFWTPVNLEFTMHYLFLEL